MDKKYIFKKVYFDLKRESGKVFQYLNNIVIYIPYI